MSRSIVVASLLALLALTGCTELPPEVAYEEQVPAEVREQLVAATEGGGEAGGAGGATFVAIDIQFESAPTSLPAGDSEVTLQNNGVQLHNLVIEGVEPSPLIETAGGETATETVTLEPGTYRFVCNIPGHEPTMNGELTVE